MIIRSPSEVLDDTTTLQEESSSQNPGTGREDEAHQDTVAVDNEHRCSICAT